MKRQYKNILTAYLIGWFAASVVWHLLRNTDLLQYQPSVLSGVDGILLFFIGWFGQALLYGLLYLFIDRYLNKKVSFKRLLVARLVLQTFVALIFVTILYYIFEFFFTLEIPMTLLEFLQIPVIPIILIYSMLVNFAILFLIQVNSDARKR